MNIRQTKISKGLIQYFNDTYPGMLNLEILDLKEISAGWETELFSFGLRYSEKGVTKKEKLVIRMYPGDIAERKLENEFFIYKNLSEQNYPVPKIHYMSANRQYVGKPFLIMDWISGGTLNDKMITNPEEGLLLFSQLFVKLHNMDWKPFIKKLKSDKDFTPSIESHIEALESRVNYNKLEELILIVDWLKDEKEKIIDEYLALGHFDFHPYNILMKENGEPVVIDWPSAKVNDFRFDLGWTLTLVCVYDNINNRNRFFDAYQKVAKKKIENIAFFEVAAIVRRLCDVLIAFKSSGESTGLRNDVVQQIKDTIFHVENLNSYLEKLSGIRVKEVDELIEDINNQE